jgi:hypothetical protein
MINRENDDAFVERVRGLLDESEAHTDERIRMRLRSARLKALEAAEERQPWYTRFPRWVTAGSIATAMVIILAVSLWVGKGPAVMPQDQVENLDLMTQKEQLELYKDLDFYRWLETDNNAG